MKKIISLAICLCIITMMLQSLALAASPVNIFNITVEEPVVGMKPSSTASVPETASVYVKNVEWSGDFDSTGCFKGKREYVVSVTVRLKDGQDKYLKEVEGKTKVNEKTAKIKSISSDKQEAVITYTFKTAAGLTTEELNDPKAITSVTISLANYGLGLKKSDVTASVSDQRLTLKNLNVTGTFGEGDTFIEGKQYRITTMFALTDKEFYIPEGVSPSDIKISGVNGTVESVVVSNKMLLSVTTSLEKLKSAETIAKEQAELAARHNHCYCGGYIENCGDHTSHSDVTYKAWDGVSKIQYTNNKAYVYLSENAVRGETLEIGGGKSLTLCLNGHSIKMTGEARVINIKVNASLRLCDCTRSTTAFITGGHEEYGAGVHNNGRFELYGGFIVGNKGGYGGGVYNNVDFFMYGGDIIGNTAIHGGGVWNDNDNTATFTMYEGAISKNSASAGGAIYNNDGATLALKGGQITENSASYGGALWNNGSRYVEIDGTAILSNTGTHAAGIWNNGGQIFIKSGYISKNTGQNKFEVNHYSCGGGIWNNEKGKIFMSGGEITFNYAFYGGGVYCNDDSEFIMSGGVIAENSAELAGGVYIKRSSDRVNPAKVRMTDKAGVVMNYSNTYAGGILVQGILEMEGEADAVLNEAPNAGSENIYVVDFGQVKKGASLPTQFVDVFADSYFLEPVKWAVDNKVTAGTSEVTFSPDDKCTRGQVITFLYRMKGSPKVTGFYYADTSPSDYFYDATRWARELGMEKANAFSPNTYCTRFSAIKYMWMAAGSPKIKRILPFTDVPQDADYAMAVAWALENGITEGTTPTTFSPNNSCTRAQIVTFLWRAVNKGLL